MSDNPFAINGVKVEKWKPNENDKNNCYWNIAKNQLDESASAQEISALSDKIQKKTESKNSTIAQRKGVLYEGDQVFLPLECAMDEIQSGVDSRQKEWSSAQTNLKTSQTALSKANDDVQKALADYHTAQANFSGVEKNNDRYETLQYSVNQAREAYIKAVNAQRESQIEADKASKEFQTRQKDLTSLQDELSGLREEYSSEKDDYKKELAALEKHITGLNDNVKTSKTSLQDANKIRLKAQNAQSTAKDLGFVLGDDGKLQLKEDPDVTRLHAALWASKDTKSVKYSNGGKTKLITYTDGTSAEYRKDEKTGKWGANPALTYTAEDTKARENKGGNNNPPPRKTSLGKDSRFPSNMTDALADMQKNIGDDYLKKSKYYKTTSDRLISQKDSDGLVIDSDTQKKMYSELKGVETRIDSMRGYLDTNSPTYNSSLAGYCKRQKVDLTSMYLDKIDSMGVKDATKEMRRYMSNVSRLMRRKESVDSKWNALAGAKLSPIEKFMLKHKYGKDDVSAIKNYSAEANLAYTSLSGYDGSVKKTDALKSAYTKYNDWSKALDEINGAKDIDSHLETTGSKDDAKAREIISLYNEYMTNRYKGGVLFSNRHDGIKRQAESVIRNYLYGTKTNYTADEALRTLRAECKKPKKS